MAAPRQRDPVLEALLKKGAAELRQINPHLSAPPPCYTEEECAEIAHIDEALAALWASPEGHRAQQATYTAADAVDEDRGE